MSYSPTLGRFLQTDPAEYVDGPNLYQSVGSNPVNRVDPLGLRYVMVPSSGPYAWANPGTGEFIDRTVPPQQQNPPVPAPPAQPWIDERNRIVALAEEWNRREPAWRFWTYECAEQSSALHDYLISKGPWKYWDLQVIGGRTARNRVLPFVHFKHHVLAVKPKKFHQQVGPDKRPSTSEVNNPSEPFLLDPFHRDCTGVNLERNVKVLTLPDFAKDWPYWIDDSSKYQPAPGTPMPSGGPVPLPLPQGKPPRDWPPAWPPSRYPGGE